MSTRNPRQPADLSAPCAEPSAEAASATAAHPAGFATAADTTEALLQAVIAAQPEPHPLQPDAIETVGELPRAPLNLDALAMVGGSLQDGAAQIAGAINALTAVLQQLLPNLQHAMAVTQQPILPPAEAAPATPVPPKTDADDDDAWRPRFVHLPPPPSFGELPRIPHPSRRFAELNRLVQTGSWDEIEAEFRRTFGHAMPDQVRRRIERTRKGLGLSGPPKQEVSWPMAESERAVPFALTPEMLLAPLRADLAKHGKPGGQAPAAASDDLDATSETPSATADDTSAPEGNASSTKSGKKPPSDLN